MRVTSRMFVLILSLLLCIAGSIAFADAPLQYTLGDKINDFSFHTYGGEKITLSEVLQKKDAVLINIWATWCGPCRNEFPFMQEAYTQYQDRIEVIALSCEQTDTAEKLSSFAKQYGLTFKIGQDPVGFLPALGMNSIPTSLIVDRFGTICFIMPGSQPDTASFVRLFDAFVGEDYTESVLFHDIPPKKPDIAPAAASDLSAALDATALNPSDAYTWPMTITEKDGLSVVTASNAGQTSSKSSIIVELYAEQSDAIVVTFKTSTEAVFDLLNITLNGKHVKSFGGEHDWMTYAIPVEEGGLQRMEISYSKNSAADSGLDTIWIDTVEVASGDAAAAAVAANPSYPVSDKSSLSVVNPDARKVLISDDSGILRANFGYAEYYVINDDTALFSATLSNVRDPEEAFFFCDYDGRVTPVLACMSETEYTIRAAVDAVEKTGYPYTAMFLYGNAKGTDVQVVVYFKDEANLNSFVKSNRLGTWTYAETAGNQKHGTSKIGQEDAIVTYILQCVDQDGHPVAGALLQICDEETCQVVTTDENGSYAFTSAEYAWEIHVLRAPEGYTTDSAEAVIAPAEGGAVRISFTKK